MVEVAVVLLVGFTLGAVHAWWRFGGRAATTGPTGSAAPRALRVERVVWETGRAVSLTLTTDAPLPFRAGQFLQIRRGPDAAWRSYSLSAAPGAPLRLTVQEVAGGAISPTLVRASRPGDALEARGPFGSFTADDVQGPLLLVAGGSGVTPIMAILEDRLARHVGRTDLILGARAPDDTLFLAALRAHAAAAPDRLRLVLRWERAPDADGALGRLDAPGIEDALRALPGDWAVAMVCGPEGVRDAARRVLGRLHPAVEVREERFHLPAGPPADGAGDRAGGPTRAWLMRPTGPIAFPVAAGETLLTAARRAGLALPSGCEVGACGACRVRVLSGEVRSPGLSDTERLAGAALACVGRCVGTVTFELEADCAT